MKSFTLNWKGWWLLRTPMSDVAELQPKCAVYAVLGAKLKKVNGGVGSSGRELVMFGVHKGDETLKEHLEKLQKMSLGVFATKRCKEIRKHPTIYAAALPEDTDIGDLSSILSLLYSKVPYAPKHHAMPEPYEGEPFHIKNAGRGIGLPEEIFHGKGKPSEDDSDRTHDGEADIAMSAAIAAEAQATRRLTQEEMDVRGIATEKVPKPEESGQHLATEKVDKPPKLVETAKLEKDDVPQGLETERVPKPPGVDSDEAAGDTEFVPKPEKAGKDGDGKEQEPEPQILDEAGREA